MSKRMGDENQGLITADVAKVLGPKAMAEQEEANIDEGKPLLAEATKEKERIDAIIRWSELAKEVKRVGQMAAPMVVVSVSNYVFEVVSIIMAGHLSKLSLSAVAIATCFADITGFCLVIGMAGALETLCGQAYGAKQYHKIGIYTYCSIICLTLVCFPISFLWIFEEKIMILLGQDPEASKQAGNYTISLIPALFGEATLVSLNLYLQTQGLTFGMVSTSLVVLCVHIPMCWVLVYKIELGISGAALSLGFSYWLCVVSIAIYIKFSRACNKTRFPLFTTEVFSSAREFFRFGVPSACMACAHFLLAVQAIQDSCFEWWSFELLILLSGTLPNSKLETSVLSICFTTISLHHLISCGIGAATSTCVSNALGSGNPRRAKASILAGLILSILEAVFIGVTLSCYKNILGYAYTNEIEVVEYVAKITPLLSISFFMDAVQAVLCGVARSSGWQNLGAYVNLGAYYLIGVPVALVLGFHLEMRGYGILIGLVVGSTVQALLLALVTSFTNWQNKAIEARERLFEHSRSAICCD